MGYGSSVRDAYIAATLGSVAGMGGWTVRPVETQAVSDRGIPARNIRRVRDNDNLVLLSGQWDQAVSRGTFMAKV
jgi:hypothetical protein